MMIDAKNGHFSPPLELNAKPANPFRAYVDLIYRRKWTIILVFLIVLASTLIYNLTRPEVYMAKAVLMIATQNVSLVPGAPMAMREENIRPLGFYQAVMGSRPFREQAMKDFLTDADDLSKTLTPLEVQELFDKNLSLLKAQYLDFMELQAKADDPGVAYLLCNVATQNLKNRCQEIDQEETQNEVTFIEKQKLLAGEKLEEIEQALQTLKDKANIRVTVADGDIINQLAGLENMLAEVQSQREMAELNLHSYETRVKQLNGASPVDLNINQSPEVLRLKSEIAQLEQQYRALAESSGAASRPQPNADATPAAQPLLEKLNDKKRQLVQAVVQSSALANENAESREAGLSQTLEEKRVLEQLNVYLLKNREVYYARQIEVFKKKNPNMLDRAMEVVRLSRSKMVYEKLYTYLIERGEEAKIKAASGTGGVRIIDPPTRPKEPLPRNLQSIILTATLCGLALGLVVALAKDKFDSSFHSEDEVASALGLTVLGMIPAIDQPETNFKENNWRQHIPFLNLKTTSGKPASSETFGEKLIIHLNPKAPIVESYRALRTNIAFLSPDRPIKKLLVTSSVPGEGKTLTSANLALSFAEIGKKVVLIDTDLRRPLQHYYFNIKKVPGLTNYLYDGMPLHEAMHEFNTSLFCLRVLPAGKLPPNPVQTLTSTRMRELIERLAEENDLIIFDTPPLISVTDPLLLSVQMDGVVMIIKASSTPREAVSHAYGKLKTARANILGAVLNNVDVSNGYGYYRYYYNYYHA